VVAVATVAVPVDALADGYSLRVVPSYQISTDKSRDATGQTHESESWAFGRQYQLSLDKTLYGTIRASGGGFLRDVHAESQSDSARFSSDQRAWNGNATLVWGNEVLNGGFGYARSDTSASSTDAQTLSTRTGVETETYNAYTRWQPLDLPSLDLRLSRTSQSAPGRSNDSAFGGVTTAYRPVEALDLRYDLSYANAQDNVSLVETRTISQVARANYKDYFFDRTSVFVSYGISNSSLTTRLGGEGGTVAVQRSPVAGWSLVEQLGTHQPEADTLVLNPGVIDGDVTQSVGIDIGFGRSAAGDTNFRDVGVQFVDATQPVNVLHVWVDRALPVGVSAAYTWTVYRSENNAVWTPVPIARPVAFGALENRFEIHIAETPATFLKVVVRPLAQGVTADPLFQTVFVTEMRAFLVRPASSVEGRTSTTQDSLNGNASTRILSVPSLRHDVSFSLARPDSERLDWQLTNGLSLAHALSPIVGVTSRVARTDTRSGGSRSGQFQYSAGLTATPLPTLSTGASFSGTVNQDPAGTSLSNSLGGFARAQLYPGIDVNWNLSLSLATSADDRSTRSTVASGNASFVPYRFLAFSAGAVNSRSSSYGGGAPETTSSNTRLDAAMTLSPYSALFASIGVVHLFGTGQTPTTLASGTVSWSPLQGGDLKMSITYSQSYDTAAHATSKLTQAGVRWRIFSYLEATTGYSVGAFETLQSEAESRAFFASLAFTLS
jgi:hypothetical protein